MIPSFVGVSMFPGAMTFVRIPLGPSSSAMLLLNPMRPYFVAQYIDMCDLGFQPRIDETLTYVLPGALMCGIVARVTLTIRNLSGHPIP